MGKIDSIQNVNINDLKPYERNAKQHSEEQVQQIADSIQEFGFLSPCLIDKNNNIIAGHGRVAAAKLIGMEEVPCVYIEGLTEEQRRAYILADNRLTELGEWDMSLVSEELEQLFDAGFDTTFTGFDFTEKEKTKEEEEREQAQETLRDRFLVPPFSVFDTRTGWWQNRKKAWETIGIRSEIGRGSDDDNSKDGLVFSNSCQPGNIYKKKNEYEAKIGRKVSFDEFYEMCPEIKQIAQSGSSIFDPVITETAVRWYTKAGDKIIDPFAGGSVRGIIPSLLGRYYTGIDLSEQQIEANRKNWEEIEKIQITSNEITQPRWIIGDSLEVLDLVGEGNTYDLLLTCPPYGDLEKYSDDPRDISNMSYDDFSRTYREIIKRTVKLLKDNAFAFVVVGDIRDRKGIYRNFVSLTIDAFIKAGMEYYNEGILINQIGHAVITSGRQFESSRKVRKIHQNVLIFHGHEEPEKEEQAYLQAIEDTGGRLEITHEKCLAFVKGDAKFRTEELGKVDAETNEEFYIDLGE